MTRLARNAEALEPPDLLTELKKKLRAL